jgi:hypothetical protein
MKKRSLQWMLISRHRSNSQKLNIDGRYRMASIYTNVLSNEDIQYLNQLPEVVAAKAKLDTYTTNGMVYFSIPITETIRTALQSRFGLDLSSVTSIPMRWIKGDTAPHVDVGRSQFEHTYLLYLNDSPGDLIIDSQTYPIEANTAFVFNEGLSHETQHTASQPRLLLGPMNELAHPVGAPLIYFSSESDALTYTNAIGSSGSYIVGQGGPFGPGGGYTHWRLASNSTGSSPQNIVYTNGSVLNSDGSYNLYPTAPCFLEGSKILCHVDGVETYVPVEELKKGTLVKTSRDGYKPVVLIGKGEIKNPGNTERIESRLYKCAATKYGYPELTSDLYITGCHSILVDKLTDIQREKTVKQLGNVFVTDKYYRLMACIDERAEPWASEGTYTIYHFALDNTNETMNYGVYANGGLLVETCSIRSLKNRSNMTLV